MVRSVEPQTAEPEDRLLPEPDPPVRSPTGNSSFSTLDREGEEPEGQEDTNVQDPELQDLEDTGEYISFESP